MQSQVQEDSLHTKHMQETFQCMCMLVRPCPLGCYLLVGEAGAEQVRQPHLPAAVGQ